MKLKSKNTVNKKKKLQTTLGKAAETPNEKDNDDDVDISHVGRSIDTSIHGLQEVVTALQNATTEVTICHIHRIHFVKKGRTIFIASKLSSNELMAFYFR